MLSRWLLSTIALLAFVAMHVDVRAEIPQTASPDLARFHADSLAGPGIASGFGAPTLHDSSSQPLRSTGFAPFEWREFPPPGPLPRQQAFAIVDEAQAHLVVVAGSGRTTYFNDVWSLALDGSSQWTRLAPLGTKPTARGAAATAWDAATHRVLLFGGIVSNTRRNDVWALTLSDPPVWADITPPVGGPTPRWGAAAVVDPARRRLLIYGGEDAAGKCGDVWALSLDGVPTWSLLAATPSPPPRAVPSAVLDPVRDRMIVFGGQNVVNEFQSDTQAFDLATRTWTPLSWAGTAPGVMDGASLTWDPVRDRLVLFGGNTGLYGNNHRLDGLWELDLTAGTAWAPLAASGTPPSPRFVMGTAYDSLRDRLLFFGGVQDAPLGDTWALTLSPAPVWSPIAPTMEWPGASVYAPGLYDARRDRMLVVGTERLLTFNLSGSPTWMWLDPEGEHPSPRYGISAILDPDSDRIVMFGGFSSLGPTNEVWALPLSGPLEWRRITPAGTPPIGRKDAAAVLDPVRHRMFVYGGDGDDEAWDLRNNTWMLNLTGPPVWTPVAVGASPGRGRSMMVTTYDPFGDRMVVAAGREGGFAPVGPWCLSFANPDAWQPLPVSGTGPIALYGANVAHDPVRNRVLVWSGVGLNWVTSEGWTLDLNSGSWQPLEAGGDAPGPRAGAASIWDPIRSRMLFWGGTSGEYFAELWELREQVPTATAVSLMEASVHDGTARLRWWWGGDPTLVRIERREHDGDWTERERRVVANDEVAFEDRDLHVGVHYEYRLSWSDSGGEHRDGLATLDVPGALRFALTGVTPNPASGPLRVAFSLTEGGDAEIALHDLAGRRLFVTNLGRRAPGAQSVSLGDSGRLPAGLYWITLRQGVRETTRRCAVVR